MSYERPKGARLTKRVDGEVQQNRDYDHPPGIPGWVNGTRDCMEKLAAYEDTGLEPEDVRRWIAVEDETTLPDGRVLATDGKTIAVAYVYYMGYKRQHWLIDHDDSGKRVAIRKDITHWMSLPEPPKGGK